MDSQPKINKNRFSVFLYFIIFLFNINISAQTPKDYAKIIVSKLASDEFSGRGYTDEGLEKSANFIETEFKKIGLKPIKNSYIQEFAYPVNIIKNSEVSFNGKPLKLGIDYLITPNSPNLKRTIKPYIFKTNLIDSMFIEDQNDLIFKNINEIEKNYTSIVFPYKIFPENYVDEGLSANDFYQKLSSGIVDNSINSSFDLSVSFVDKKLIHSLASEPSKTVGIQVLKDKFNDQINEINVEINSYFEPNFKTKNVFGMIEGKSKKDSIIFISAHYDHLGKIGNTIFSGANDNASGIAMILSLAKYFSKKPSDYTLIFCAFSGEEIGLKGSDFFVNNSPINLKNIKIMLNFDMVGTGEDGIQIVNSKKYPKQFNTLLDINDKYKLLKQLKYRGESCNSDHCPFDRKKVPAFFIYTLGGTSYYHDIYDKAETLQLTKFNEVLSLFIKYIEN